MTARTDQVARAEALLGYQFAYPELLREALTHRSASRGTGRGTPRGQPRGPGLGSNERLEFIGDRVLGLVMAEWLIERFPVEQEGQLGPRHAYLVSRPVLAEIGASLGLSAALSLGTNEAQAGVGKLATVLADAIEAMIGALYLDGGLPAARDFIRDAWESAMASQVLPPKDPKTALQEWLLGRGQPLPTYELVRSDGPSHAPRFVIAVRGAGQSAEGQAGTKRAAEREAAAGLLAKLA